MRKMTKKDLASIAKQCRSLSPIDLDGMIGGNRETYMSYEEFMSINDFSTWDGAYVAGITEIGGKLYYNGGTQYAYISELYGGGTQSPTINILDYETWKSQQSPSIDVSMSVLTKDQFVGYDKNYRRGCLDRCKDMLGKVGMELDGKRIGIMTPDKWGHAEEASGLFTVGVEAINDSLSKGIPVVVGIDYKDGSPNNDKMTDHFVVIVSSTTTKNSDGSYVTQYNFYDPATSHTDVGTSDSNILTVGDGRISGSFTTASGEVRDYTVTSVRTVKDK